MKVIVNGSCGHMGRILTGIIEQTDDMEVIAGVAPSGEDGAYTSLDEYAGEADIVIDFSHHAGTEALMNYCTKRKLPVIVATTGQTDEERAMIEAASKEIPVFFSANMSVGVALVAKIAKEITRAFGDCDIELVEAHHNRKIDAPSGTALMLARGIQEERPELEIHCGRSGKQKREKNEIGVQSIRMGNIVGMHEVMFGTNNQTITIKHEAHDRALFADGAVAAARFLVKQPAGLYTMDDYLG